MLLESSCVMVSSHDRVVVLKLSSFLRIISGRLFPGHHLDLMENLVVKLTEISSKQACQGTTPIFQMRKGSDVEDDGDKDLRFCHKASRAISPIFGNGIT